MAGTDTEITTEDPNDMVFRCTNPKCRKEFVMRIDKIRAICYDCGCRVLVKGRPPIVKLVSAR